MKFALSFLSLAAVTIVCAFTAGSRWLSLIWLYVSVSLLLVGLAFTFQVPRLFLKKADGTFSIFAYPLLWPFMVSNLVSLALFRLAARAAPFQEIVPNLILGCRLSVWDSGILSKFQIRSVLDLTSEFREVGFLRNVSEYRCIPLLDRSAPTTQQLETGVEFIRQNIAKGPVYVHCALGHGRSATFVIAYLVASGVCKTLEEALVLIQNKRRGVHLSNAQTKVVREFTSKYFLNEGNLHQH
jgi:Dual specificity phosphatase, catalytic domain